MSDKSRDKLLEHALREAAFDGWTDMSLRRAVESAGLPEGSEELFFPKGPTEVISYWSAQCDARAAKKIRKLKLDKLKIRERITQAVIIRLSETADNESAASRALSRLALPDALGIGPKLLWNSSDMIWRAIGDTSTDRNFYSKRTVLSAVIASTAPVWLSDQDPKKNKARAFLNSRIENVMQFEKVKAQGRKLVKTLPDPVSILTRLRYGKGRRRY